MIANNSSPLVELSDSEVLAQTLNAARNERVATARLIQLLMEVDQRRVYLGEGCSSLFTDCTQVLRLSEHAAYNRIESVARCTTNCDEHRTCCAMRCRTAIRRSSSRGRSNYCLRSSSERASVQSHTLERCVNPTTLRVMFPLQSDERSGSAMRVAAHFAGARGRCTETGLLEYHHVVPFADGGETTASHLELRCRSHNQYEADLWSGVAQSPPAREAHAIGHP